MRALLNTVPRVRAVFLQGGELTYRLGLYLAQLTYAALARIGELTLGGLFNLNLIR